MAGAGAIPWMLPLLVAARWWALLQVQVLWRRAIGPWWTAVALGLAVVLALAEGPAWGFGPRSGLDPWLAVAAELALGALVGLVVALPGHAVLGAAEVGARVLGTAPSPWRALVLCLVGATALSLSLHRPLLVGARAVFETWPVGEPAAWGWGALGDGHALARLAHGLALVALTLATPALLAGALAELVLRAVGSGPRAAAPAVDALAPWLRVAAAAIATGASWAAYDAVWAARALSVPG